MQSNLTYRIVGAGAPVVLVHGFGEDSSIWRNQVDHLKDKVKLIIVDLPTKEDENKWTLPYFADLIKNILDIENIETCNMFGHSMGGYITLAFADKYPDRLKGFGLIHSSAFADSDEKIATRRKGIAFIKENGAAPFLETMIPNLFSPLSREKQQALVNETKRFKDNFSPDALVRYYEAMIERPDRTDILKESKIPVLFIMGKYDTAIPLEDGLKQCHLPENAYIHILRNSGHMGILEEPGESNMALDEFLLYT